MATKRLSKTVIEGGRNGHNKYERRHSSKAQRAKTREYMSNVFKDLEFSDSDMEPDRNPVYKEFSDKLSPMYRWLESQLGRPWSEVRSEVFEKFDTRTTAGRHITFDHLLREVVDTESGFDNRGFIADPLIPKEEYHQPKRGYYRYRSYRNYYVDRDGILRGMEDRHKRHYRRWEPCSIADFKAAEDFLAGRMVVEYKGKYHWMSASEDVWRATWTDLENKEQYPGYGRKLRYYILDNGLHDVKHTYVSTFGGTYTMMLKTHSDFWKEIEFPFSFRRRGELTEEELKTFKSLRESLREAILDYTKERNYNNG